MVLGRNCYFGLRGPLEAFGLLAPDQEGPCRVFADCAGFGVVVGVEMKMAILAKGFQILRPVIARDVVQVRDGEDDMNDPKTRPPAAAIYSAAFVVPLGTAISFPPHPIDTKNVRSIRHPALFAAIPRTLQNRGPDHC